MKPWLAWVAGIYLCGCATGLSQSLDPSAATERLAAVAKSYTEGNAFMGAVLVVKGNDTLLDQGYGLADLEWNIPNVPDTRFRLGSLTKQFTATLVLLLQQDGRLRIEDPVSKYLPDTPKAWEKITLANLLGHTSGIPNFTSDKEFPTWCTNPHTHAEEIAFFRDKPLAFEPGGQYAYSNSNYEVLGTVIEKVSGQEYGDLLRTRLFEPLGMRSSGLDTDELVLPKRAQGYLRSKDVLLHARSESMTVPWAAGSVYSTTADLLRWERGLFGGQVLKAASLQAMTTAGKGDYGLGVEITHHNGVTVVEHAGGIEGFNTQLSYVPEEQITVAVLSNVNGAAPIAMGAQLLDVALGRPVVLRSERRAVPLDKEKLQSFVGVYDFESGSAYTLALNGDVLTLQSRSGAAHTMMYQGMAEGHARFFVPDTDAEIEFVPAASGEIASLVMHLGGERTAKRRAP